MNNIDLTPILTAFITLVVAIITYYVIPVLKSKVSVDKWNEIMKWVKIAVAAAEQMENAGLLNYEKKNYVIEFLKSKGYKVNEDELNAAIEAAVYELNLNQAPYITIESIPEEVIENE